MKRRTFASAVAGALSLAVTARSARAQAYPSKPIVMVSWSAAGSPIDIMEREIAKLAPKYLSQTIVVQDKTGGGTANAISYLFSRPADGYTMLGVTDSILIALKTTLKGKFTLDQFDFIGQLVSDPYVIAVNSASPLRTWADLAKSTRTSNLTIGGAFAESNKSFFARDIGSTTGIKFQYVPFDGSSTSITAALGGHVDAVVANVSAVASYVQSGQMRALVTSAAQPESTLPGTPTFASLGYESLTAAQWRGLATRAGLPVEARAKLVAFTKQVAADSDFKRYCASQHLPEKYADPETLAKMISNEEAAIARGLAKTTGSK